MRFVAHILTYQQIDRQQWKALVQTSETGTWGYVVLLAESTQTGHAQATGDRYLRADENAEIITEMQFYAQ